MILNSLAPGYSANDLIEASKDLKKIFEISKRFLEKQGIK
jgi:hypothetical protein